MVVLSDISEVFVPTVRASHFDGIVDRNYRNARKKLFEEAHSLLKDHDKIRTSVEGFANKLLSKAMASGIQKSLAEGRFNVVFDINVGKEARRLWGSYPPKLKTQLPADLIVLALELVFADAGFQIDMVQHSLRYDRQIPDKAQKVEVVKEEPVNGESLNSVLEQTPALPGPTEPSAQESEEEEEGEEEEEEEVAEDDLDAAGDMS